MPNNVSVGTRVTGVGKASSELDRLRDKFDRLQKQGAKGFAIGAGAAITAKGLSLLDSALSRGIDLLGDATEAALEEEESIAKLDAALRANVKGWDGNSAAIEKVLHARMELGFSDDEQRASLALLVAATGDYNKALLIQRTAMDLARLKGISLAQASEALVKVEAGQFRVLKSLGIELEKGATQTEALAAVQKVAAGQAEAYANTNRGKLLASQIKVGEAMERFGGTILPAVTAATEAASEKAVQLADALTLVSSGVQEVADNVPGGQSALDALLQAADPSKWTDITGRFETFADIMDDLGVNTDETRRIWKDFGINVEQAGAAAEGAESSLTSLTGKGFSGMNDAEDHAKALAGAIGTIGDEAETASGKVRKSNQEIVDDFEGSVERLTTLGEQAADAIYDPIIAAGELAATEREIAEQRQIIASKKSTKEQVADAKLRLAELNKKRIGLMSELTAYGKTSHKQQVEFINDLRKKYVNGTTAQRAAINLLIGQLKSLWTWQERVNDNAFDSSSHRRASTGGRRADGGPVEAKTPYLVGEQGPELFMPSTDGQIIPAGPTRQMMSGASGGSSYGPLALTVVVQDQTMTGMTPGQARQVGEAIGPALFEWGRRNRWVAAR